MSIVCNYYYTITENGKKRLILGSELRKLLCARYRAQRNQYRFQHQLREMTRFRKRLGDAGSADAESRTALRRLTDRLNEARKDLDGARMDLDRQVRSLEMMAEGSTEEKAAVEKAVAEAMTAMSEMKDLAEADLDHADTLVRAMDEAFDLTAAQRETEDEISRLEREIRFTEMDAAFSPAALATLEAMQDNGYILREAITEKGLLSYFEQADTGHLIAVRLAEPLRANDEETWEMLTETFRMSGETCLMEIEDFETAMEEKEIGVLTPGDLRIYPKVQNSAEREKRGLLPAFRRRKRAGTEERVGIPSFSDR